MWKERSLETLETGDKRIWEQIDHLWGIRKGQVMYRGGQDGTWRDVEAPIKKKSEKRSIDCKDTRISRLASAKERVPKTNVNSHRYVIKAEKGTKWKPLPLKQSRTWQATCTVWICTRYCLLTYTKRLVDTSIFAMSDPCLYGMLRSPTLFKLPTLQN